MTIDRLKNIIIGCGFLVMAGILPLSSSAQSPTWWTNRAILDASLPNDYAILNQGQLKWLATQTALEFSNSVYGFSVEGSNILSLVHGFNPIDGNYRPVNFGQLKTVAQPFYDYLRAQGLTNAPPLNTDTPYPWSNIHNPSNDYALINIGQAKQLFSFDGAGSIDTNDLDASVSYQLTVTSNLWVTAEGVTLGNWEARKDYYGLIIDGYQAVDLPWAMPFYSTPYSNALISIHGMLSFLQGGSAYPHSRLPSISPPVPFMAPFWDDLALKSNSRVSVATLGAVGQRLFVVTWKDIARNDDPSACLNFQIVLVETNASILFNYGELSGACATGNEATVGIQASPVNALEYSFNIPGAVIPQRSLIFTPMYRTMPWSSDADGDGLPNSWEVAHGLNPFWAGDVELDSDGDGLSNLDEFNAGTKPNNPDTDGDGLNDAWEVRYGMDPLVPALPTTDTDHDDLADLQELAHGTNPQDPDTDHDGLLDGQEVQGVTDPLIADCDGDGLLDGEELALGADPHNPDSDNDGLSDGLESKTFVVSWTSPTEFTIHSNLVDGVQMAVNGDVLLLLKPDGHVVSWSPFNFAPIFSNVTNAISVAAGADLDLGYRSAVALLSNGSVASWSIDEWHSESRLAEIVNAKAVASGGYFSSALLSNGCIVAWTLEENGSLFSPVQIANASAIAMGSEHGLALLSNGCVQAWGYYGDSYGNVSGSEGLSNVTAIAASGYHSLALSNGCVVAWGCGDQGQSTVPLDATNAMAIAASVYGSMYTTPDGRLHGFGNVTDCPIRGEFISFGAMSSGEGYALIRLGTCPTNSDSDADGLEDGVEFCFGSNPADSNSCAPVAILASPTNALVCDGDSASFNVSAISAQPLSYQWLRNGSPISAATDSSYIIPVTTSSDSGAGFSVVVSSARGSATSAVAILTLKYEVQATSSQGCSISPAGGVWVIHGQSQPFSISTQENWRISDVMVDGQSVGVVTNFTFNSVTSSHTIATSAALPPMFIAGSFDKLVVAPGQGVILGTTISGTPPFSYQWMREGVAISGATNNSFAAINVGAGNVGFSVSVTNKVGVTATNVTVSIPDEETEHTVDIGKSVTFNITTNGGPIPVFQWFMNESLITHATNSSYTIPMTVTGDNGAEFCAIVSNSYGCVTSAVAVLTVTNCAIDAAADAGGTISPSGHLGRPIGSSQTFAIAPDSNHGILDIVVDGVSVGASSSYEFVDLVTSHSIHARFGVAPSINNNPQSASFLEGQPATFSVGASGYPLYYQWLRSDLPISGATNAVYISGAITTNDNEAQFAVIVTNMFGSVTSSVAVLTVEPLDADGDGMYDRWETNFLPYPNCSTNALRDEDNDGLNNLEEFRLGTNPTNWDSDCDGLSDGIEVKNFVVTWSSSPNATIHTNMLDAVSVAVNNGYSLILYSNGCVASRGNGWWYSPGPLTIPAVATNAIAIAARYEHSLALLANGKVVDWSNTTGQSFVPESVTNAKAISAGYGGHSLALLSNSNVVAWGNNSSGQTNVPASVTNAIAIASGVAHSLALLSNGEVVTWGEQNVQSGPIGAVAISSGWRHSLALLSDGRVVAWGDNGNGQTSVPGSVMNAVAISAGQNHSLALLANGRVVAWGCNTYGQTNVPAAITNAISILALNDVSLALTADGRIHGWGKMWDCPLRAKYISYSFNDQSLGEGIAVARFSTCPTNNDTDGDGMLDKWEIDHGFDPTDPADGALDSDCDGLLNTNEVMMGTNPFSPDSDGDGICDGEEVERVAGGVLLENMNPTVNNSEQDQDGDGLKLAAEIAWGSDPFCWDSDGDGIKDGDDTNPVVFNQEKINTDVQGYSVTVELKETRILPNTNSPMGRGILTICGQTLRVLGANGTVIRTLHPEAGRNYDISLIDGRPNDPRVVRMDVAVYVNGTQVSTNLILDPGGIISPEGTYFPRSQSSASASMKTTKAGLKTMASTISSATTSGSATLPLPSVTICYQGTTTQVFNHCFRGNGDRSDFEAVISPSGAPGHLSWTNAEVTAYSGAWRVNYDDAWLDNWWAYFWNDWRFYEGKMTVTFLPAGTSVGVTNTATFHYRTNFPSWSNPYDHPNEEHKVDLSRGSDKYGGGGIPFNNNDDNLSGSPDLNESPVVGEKDLIRIGFSGSGCWFPFCTVGGGSVTTGKLSLISGNVKFGKDSEKATGQTPGPIVFVGGGERYIEGRGLSSSLGDVAMEERYAGFDSDVVSTGRFTVLRLDVQADFNHDGSIDLADQTHVESQAVPGLILACGSNNLVKVKLLTDCGLTAGHVTLSLVGSGLKLWATSSPVPGAVPYLQSGQSIEWSGAAISSIPHEQAFFLEGMNAGKAAIVYSYTDTDAPPTTYFTHTLPVTMVKIDLKNKWLVTHDIDFEKKCIAPSAMQQANLTTNRAKLNIEGGAGLPFSCELMEHGIIWSPKSLAVIPDAPEEGASSSFIIREGADAGANKEIRINDITKLPGPTDSCRSYSLDVKLYGVKFASEPIVIKPLLIDLAFSPDIAKSLSATNDPYADHLSLWTGGSVDTNCYGLLMKYVLQNDVTNMTAHVSNKADASGDINGVHSLVIRPIDMKRSKISPTYWFSRLIKWEGFDANIEEYAGVVTNFPEPAISGGAYISPIHTVKEGNYVLNLEVRHVDDRSQCQKFLIPLNIGYKCLDL